MALGEIAIEQSPELSRHNKEELGLVLFRQHQAGDPVARDKLILSFSGLVQWIAWKFARGDMDLFDNLYQEGMIGVIKGIDLYCPERKTKMSTFVTHFIIGEIKHYFRDRHRTIKIAAWALELISKIDKEIAREQQGLDTNQSVDADPDDEKLVQRDFVDQVRTLMSCESLSETDPETGDLIHYDIPAPPPPIVLDDRLDVERLIETLPPLQRNVVRLHYYDGLNQTEISKRLNISCNYVSHILCEAPQNMRFALSWQITRSSITRGQLGLPEDSEDSYLRRELIKLYDAEPVSLEELKSSLTKRKIYLKKLSGCFQLANRELEYVRAQRAQVQAELQRCRKNLQNLQSDRLAG